MSDESPNAENDATVVEESTTELGEGGVKALQAEREARKAAEKLTAELSNQLKAIEDRDKTEAQRQQEELETARAELAALTSAKTRAEVAAEKSVPTVLLAGPKSDSAKDIAAYADALLAFRGEQSQQRLRVPNEGRTPSTQIDADAQFARELFGS